MTLSLEYCYSKGLGVVDGLWMRQKPLKVLRHPSNFFVHYRSLTPNSGIKPRVLGLSARD